MRSMKNKAGRLLRPMFLAATCVLAAAAGATTITALGNINPGVGDIIAFTASSTAPIEDSSRLVVHRPDQYGCVIDLNVVHRSGGSLIVESRIGGDASGFRVHWAGARTSADTGNCGTDADLIVDHRDLGMLALSAGGYGVGPKPKPVFLSSIGE